MLSTPLSWPNNRLVTVFLRKLEYYKDILFLTTSRMIQFGKAIINRTHLTIKYQGLTRDFRREVWKNLLSKAQTIQGPAIVSDDKLHLLENFPLNGQEVSSHIDSQYSPANRHQIKNLLSIGHALATVKKQQVSFKHLEMAAESNKKLSEVVVVVGRTRFHKCVCLIQKKHCIKVPQHLNFRAEISIRVV